MRLRSFEFQPETRDPRAGKYIADIFAGGKGTAWTTPYVGKLLEPIKASLILLFGINAGTF